jgi:DNA-binding MarR family transcriptional regulator
MLNARQKEVSPYHISPQQAYLLFILHNVGHKTTLPELVKYSHKNINTLSKELTMMAKDGLIQKTHETPKSTILTIHLTAKGLEIYDNTKKLKSDKAIMSALSEEERQRLISMLNKIINGARDYRPQSDE